MIIREFDQFIKNFHRFVYGNFVLLDECCTFTIPNKEDMAVIQLTDASAPFFLRMAKDRLEAIEEEVKPIMETLRKLNAEKKELRALIDQVKGSVPAQVIDAEYNPKETLLNKITYILRKNPEPLTSRQIANSLMTIDPELAKYSQQTTKNVSTIISINRGEGKAFRRIEEEGKDNTFVLNAVN